MEYGLTLGLPGVGGILGALCTQSLTRRIGARSMLLTFGVLRTLWAGLIPAAPHGVAGMLVIVTSDFLLLFCAGVFNPSFATYRMRATADEYMSRVQTAWSISSRTFQPLFILVGGVVAAMTSTRFALAADAVLLLASALCLPWRSGWDEV